MKSITGLTLASALALSMVISSAVAQDPAKESDKAAASNPGATSPAPSYTLSAGTNVPSAESAKTAPLKNSAQKPGDAKAGDAALGDATPNAAKAPANSPEAAAETRLPAMKGASESPATAAAPEPSDKMSGASNEDAADENAAAATSQMPAAKTGGEANAPAAKSAKSDSTKSSSASKQQRQPMRIARATDNALTADEKQYRDALRQCVQQQDPSSRDACLDNAIGRFRSNS
jgi:hypothetical protein